MTLNDFIKEHRKELDSIIGKAMGMREGFIKTNDRERRLWILNDEGLYNWARSEGVRI